MALDATPGGAAADSYATLAEFDAYLAAHLDGAAVATKTNDQKERALKTATRQMDAYLVWGGSAVTLTQALAVPRSGLTDPQTGATISTATIPARVRNACCEQARLLLASGDRTTESAADAEGLEAIKAGSVELRFKSGSGGNEVRSALAPSAYAFIASWVTQAGQVGAGGAIALARV